MEKIKIGISSCLLGNEVRYNGQHQLDHFLKDTLSQWCDYVPVCPEVACGLPIPRESMRLVGKVENPQLITSRTGINHTERMQNWIKKELDVLEKENLVAFVFKTKSPSSGMRKVKVYNEEGHTISYAGIGMFARAFMERFPDIPVEDEGRLTDPGLREQFIESIFVLQRWREAVQNRQVKDIVQFHSRHKYTLMAHSNEKLKLLGKMIADSGARDFDELVREYRSILFQLLSIKKNRKKNYNVLLHMQGYFKKILTADEKAELLMESENYYKGLSPVVVPITLLRHYTRKYNETYLADQYYLHPHPVEMGLLNHV
jgi:uncharacterized protein YbgA (DUF1722 family)/uncharacterized protein YbbK (DUF523 family)